MDVIKLRSQWEIYSKQLTKKWPKWARICSFFFPLICTTSFNKHLTGAWVFAVKCFFLFSCCEKWYYVIKCVTIKCCTNPINRLYLWTRSSRFSGTNRYFRVEWNSKNDMWLPSRFTYRVFSPYPTYNSIPLGRTCAIKSKKIKLIFIFWLSVHDFQNNSSEEKNV